MCRPAAAAEFEPEFARLVNELQILTIAVAPGSRFRSTAAHNGAIMGARFKGALSQER
jgi:hypothetical protein